MSSNIARKESLGRAGPCPRGVENLSPREQEILELLARGFMYKEIAESLNIRVVTVNSHVRRIYEKLRVRSRAQAVARYVLKPLRGERSAAAPQPERRVKNSANDEKEPF
jgi:DNA-binding NarL/FixJ family response regulator